MLRDYINTIYDEDIRAIFNKLTLSVKMISVEIDKSQLYYYNGNVLDNNMHVTNYHGDKVKKIDLIANNIFIKNLSSININKIISEENIEPLIISETGKYVVAIDPLDGSSNIEASITVGSIFGIYENTKQFGNEHLEIIASGYAIYSSSTIIVLCHDNLINSFVLDKNIGEFIKHRVNIKIPKYSKIFSVNYGLYNDLNDYDKNILSTYVNKGYSLRYVGSMVIDIHRTLLYGGIFMYPGTINRKNGKLRYYYEVVPLSFIINTAGGVSYISMSDSGCKNINEHIMHNYHDTVPIYTGSSDNFKELI